MTRPRSSPAASRGRTAAVVARRDGHGRVDGEQPLQPRRMYALKHGTSTVRVRVEEIVSGLDLSTGRQDPSVGQLGPNDLGVLRLRAAAPIVHDAYEDSRATGSFVLFDEVTDATVAAGMLHA